MHPEPYLALHHQLAHDLTHPRARTTRSALTRLTRAWRSHTHLPRLRRVRASRRAHLT